ncbi:MAG TPA: cupredoxin family copper-binding protein [Polyangia bacterium]
MAATSAAVPVTTRTPNLSSPETTTPVTGDFLFTHRFMLISDKVVNSPTFSLDIGILSFLSVGLRYATSSDIDGSSNELEPRLTIAVLKQKHHYLDLTLIGAYNTAAYSGDGSVVLRRRFGPVSVLAEVRGFSAGYAYGGPTLAAGAGLQVRLTRYLMLVGDANHVLWAHHWDRIKDSSDRLGWSGGIAFRIPYSPHSASIQVTNGNTHTLEGASRGTKDIRIGFEFEVPFTNARRWAAIVRPPPEPASQPAVPAAGEKAAVEVVIKDFAFEPREIRIRRGAVVRWVNRDDVEHTATADDRSFDSGILRPGASWSRRFDAPGRYPYFCTVHPNMRAVLVVE